MIPEGTARAAWYDLLGVPQFMVDGVLLRSGGVSQGSLIDRYLPLVESRLHLLSPLIMAGQYAISGSEVTLTVAIEVDRQVRTLQNRVEFFVCQEGMYEQSNMVVDMLTPEPFTLTEKGETVEVQRQFTLDPAWTVEALRLVVIVQDRETKEVLQATLASRDETSAVQNNSPQMAAVLRPAYPNPFNSSTTISFTLAHPGPVCLEVLTIAGHRLRTLVQNHLEAGDHAVLWRGDDRTGTPVASGTYFYRLKFGAEPVQNGSMTLVK